MKEIRQSTILKLRGGLITFVENYNKKDILISNLFGESFHVSYISNILKILIDEQLVEKFGVGGYRPLFTVNKINEEFCRSILVKYNSFCNNKNKISYHKRKGDYHIIYKNDLKKVSDERLIQELRNRGYTRIKNKNIVR